MAWYSTGTIAVTNGSTTVTGTGTDFVGNVLAGQGIILPDGRTYEIAAIVSATQITLGTAYLGSTASGQSYVVQPTRGPDLILVQQMAALISGYGTAFINAGQGKFAAGSATVPSLRNLADENTGINFLGSDQFELVTNGIRRALLSTTAFNLSVPITGTAVTQSATDATAGRLVKAGDSATILSASPALRMASGGTANAITLTSGAGISGLPPTGLQLRFRAGAANTGATTIALDGGTARAVLTITGTALPAGYIRTDTDTVVRFNGTNWIADREIERGSNANGEYVRFADGTQICYGGITTSASAGVTWTYPAAFFVTPKVFASPAGSAARSDTWVARGNTSVDWNCWNVSGTREAVAMDVRVEGRWY